MSDRPTWDVYEIAWAAGYFDGEGSAGFYRGKGSGKSGGVALSIGNTQLAELERFQRAVLGVGRISGPRHLPNRKPIWTWKAQSFESAQAVVSLLWKYMSENKRHDCLAALSATLADRRRTAASPFCVQGHEEVNRVSVRGRPRCRKCLAAHFA